MGMADLERVYTVPLQDIFSKRRLRRGKYAISRLRAFAMRHMKAAEVKIGTGLSRFILSSGIKSPPRSVKVTATKDEAGRVWLNLFGEKPEEMAAEMKVEAPKKEDAHKREHAREKQKSEVEKKAEKEAIKAEMKK